MTSPKHQARAKWQDTLARWNFEHDARQDFVPADWHLDTSIRRVAMDVAPENVPTKADEYLTAVKTMLKDESDGMELVKMEIGRNKANGQFLLVITLGRRLTFEELIIRDRLAAVKIEDHETFASYKAAIKDVLGEEKFAEWEKMMGEFTEMHFAMAKGKKPSEVIKAEAGYDKLQALDAAGTILFEDPATLRAGAKQLFAASKRQDLKKFGGRGPNAGPGFGPGSSGGLRLL